MGMFPSMFPFVTFLAVAMPILELVLIIVAIYTLFVLIKALNIYIRNNS